MGTCHDGLVACAIRTGEVPRLTRLRAHHRYSPLPKSAQPARVVSNADLYDFEIAAEDMARLDALDQGKDGAISWNPVDAP